MSASSRGELTPAAYFERVLSALCRVNGGELRIKGEEVDRINEATSIAFYWDRKTQELVIRGAKDDEMLVDIFRVTPENASRPAVVPPQPRLVNPAERSRTDTPTEFFLRGNNAPMDDASVTAAEKARAIRLAKQLVKRMLEEREINAG